MYLVCQTIGMSDYRSDPVSSTNKTDRHDITEILWKVALNTIKPHYFKSVSTVQLFLHNIMKVCTTPVYFEFVLLRYYSYALQSKSIQTSLHQFSCTISLFLHLTKKAQPILPMRSPLLSGHLY